MFRARQTSWVSSHFSLLTVPNFFLTASTCTDKSLTCCFNRKYALFSITINSITNLIYDFTIYKANKSTFQHPTKLPKSKSPVGAHCHSSKYKILRSDLKYFHTTIPLPIFAQTKTLIISIIKGNACYLHPCSNSIHPSPVFRYPTSLYLCFSAQPPFPLRPLFAVSSENAPSTASLQFLRLLLQLIIHIPSVPAQQLVFYLFKFFMETELVRIFICQPVSRITFVHDI